MWTKLYDMFLLLEARKRKKNEKNYQESQMCLKEHKEENKTKRSKKTTRNKGIKCSSSLDIYFSSSTQELYEMMSEGLR